MISAQASFPVIGVDFPPLRICAGPKLQGSTEAGGRTRCYHDATSGRSGTGLRTGSPPQPLAVTAPGPGRGERTFAKNLNHHDVTVCSVLLPVSATCPCDLSRGRGGQQFYTLWRIFMLQVTSRDNKRFVSHGFRAESAIAPDSMIVSPGPLQRNA